MAKRPKPARSARTRPKTQSRTRSTSARRTPSPAPPRSRTGGRLTPQAELRPSDLETLSKAALLDLAKSLGLRGRHRLAKDDLIHALRDLMTDSPRPPDEPTPPAASQEARPPTEPDPGGLPWRYGVTELVALPVDPVLVYLYWELTPDAINVVRRALGPAWEGAPLVLRAYDVAYVEFDGTNAHAQFDTEVWGDVGSWYLHLWRPEQTLLFEIGWRGRDGRFVAAARSNLVQTPRNAPCATGDERWMTITDEGPITAAPDAVPTGRVPEQDAPPITGRGEPPWSATLPTSGLASRRFQR